MLQVTIRWSGSQMGAGVSVLNFTGAVETSLDPLLEGVDDFVAAFSLHIPQTVGLQVANTVDVISESNGNLIATVSGTAQPARTGAASNGPVAAGVGGRIRWTTGGTRNSRPVIGTTFLVPMATGSFEANGTLTSTAVTAFQDAGNLLLGVANAAGAPLAVWSKPTSEAAANGELWPVTGVVVPDQVSWLTSRRS